MPFRGQQLSKQFYTWERRGRGWQLATDPIELEPCFDPFFRFTPSRHIDDGKRNTLLSSFRDLFIKSSNDNNSKQLPYEIEAEPPTFLYEYVYEELTAISIAFPKGYKVSSRSMMEFFIMLSPVKRIISFEIIADAISITIQAVCHEDDRRFIESQLLAYFHEAIIQDTTDSLDTIIDLDQSIYLTDFGLLEEYMRPLAMNANLDHDPYVGLFGILEKLQGSERAVLQILFTKTSNPWEENIVRSVSDNKGGCFFIDAPEMLTLAKEKVSKPLFAVTVRMLAQSDSLEEAGAVLERIGHSFILLSKGTGNQLMPLNNLSYDVETRMEDILARTSHRTGMLLNVQELMTLAHFPSASIYSQKLRANLDKTKPLPYIAEGHEYILGNNTHLGTESLASISEEQRLRHMHIIGATGTGKSTLLVQLIQQDIKHNKGVAVIDPHGDLIETILSIIPKNRIDDVVVIDPSDTEYAVGFNILHANSDIEKDVLSSDLVASFKKLSTSWGDQMNSVLANAILAFLESTKGGTLADLRHFLLEKQFRDDFLRTVTDANVVYYWQKEFPIVKNNSIGPILTRLDTFLRPKLIRNMIIQKQGLDFEQLMDSNKIILIKLSQGLIGTENSYLLGTFIVSKIHQAAMARQLKAKEDRKNFFLYIDEFQHFITPSMSSILSGARKYHLGLVLAHQDLQQLQRYDSELSNTLLSNAGTRICFRVGDADARKLEDGFSYFTASDLQNLSTGEAIARIERPDYDFSMTAKMFYPDSNENFKEEIFAVSRGKYAVKSTTISEDFIADVTQSSQEENSYIRDVNTNLATDALNKEASETEIKKNIEEAKKQKIIKDDKDAVYKKEREHTYLQRIIKLTAESKGYKATLEVVTPQNNGRVDVLLERNKKTIACEVCITTDVEWEVHNIQKCVAAGYDIVVEICSDKKILEKIKQSTEKIITPAMQQIIFYFLPEEFYTFLNEQIAEEASTETRIKGYRVKVTYDAPSDIDMKKKTESVAKIVGASLRKKK
jgi:hypothetical protein